MTETTTEVHRFTKEDLAKQALCLAVLDITGSLLAGKIGDSTIHWLANGGVEIRTEVTGVWRLERGEMQRDDPRRV